MTAPINASDVAYVPDDRLRIIPDTLVPIPAPPEPEQVHVEQVRVAAAALGLGSDLSGIHSIVLESGRVTVCRYRYRPDGAGGALTAGNEPSLTTTTIGVMYE